MELSETVGKKIENDKKDHQLTREKTKSIGKIFV